MSEPKASPRLRAKLQNYQFTRAERNFAASSSTDSPPSPHGSTLNSTSLASRRGRPPLKVRPQSSDQRNKERIRIQTIEEKSTRMDPLEQSNDLHASRLSRDVGEDVETTKVVLKKNEDDSDRASSSRPQSTRLQERNSQPSLGKAKLARPSWIRTRSGGVWYQNNSSPYDSGSTKSGTSYFSGQEESEGVKIDISPLKPPPRPEGLVSEPVNQVVVETPFGHHQNVETEVNNSPTIPGSREHRRSSVDVKRLFSAPLTIFRRTHRDNQNQLMSLSSTRTKAYHSPNTSIDRQFSSADHVATTLNRVSSVLEAEARPTLAGRIRSWTHKSIVTASSSDPNDSRQSQTRILTSVVNPVRKGSLEHALEDTSSILNLLSGATPPNSTSDKATYRVRRRPSAESEEFLKIDISIRGGTSYLASEARRVTTPPLPGDNSTGSRKGFFFDYKAPDWDEDDCMEQRDHTSAKFETIGSAILNRAYSSSNRTTLSKQRTGDWYETQLADLDTASVVSSTIQPQSEMNHRCRHECQTGLAEIRRLKYEAQLDFTIPEHLPTSPLCPRNPKYWRVKEQRGSQFRGCWMHGYGEYEVVPGQRR